MVNPPRGSAGRRSSMYRTVPQRTRRGNVAVAWWQAFVCLLFTWPCSLSQTTEGAKGRHSLGSGRATRGGAPGASMFSPGGRARPEDRSGEGLAGPAGAGVDQLAPLQEGLGQVQHLELVAPLAVGILAGPVGYVAHRRRRR